LSFCSPDLRLSRPRFYNTHSQNVIILGLISFLDSIFSRKSIFLSREMTRANLRNFQHCGTTSAFLHYFPFCVVMSLDEPGSKSTPVVEITEGLDMGIIGVMRLDNLPLKMRRPCTIVRFACGDWKPSRGLFPFATFPGLYTRLFFMT